MLRADAACDCGARTPTIGRSGDSCARAASGQAAAPPMSEMNSRRSFDHSVGTQKEGVRDRKAHGLRGL
jgi:hypothetical protein